ncbi:helix-turn-helix domain-containing protein [Miltoncostaea oceani]|uniref:helix-turn-helix domain-containing protein n=1 Tax=Miltoncostaea oceani TaxID=2843216 RepID=UPI001C3CDABF
MCQLSLRVSDDEPRLSPESLAERSLALCDQLEKARMAAGISRRELARRAGLDPGTVAAVLEVRSDPHLETILRIGGALGLRLEVTPAHTSQ